MHHLFCCQLKCYVHSRLAVLFPGHLHRIGVAAVGATLVIDPDPGRSQGAHKRHPYGAGFLRARE